MTPSRLNKSASALVTLAMAFPSPLLWAAGPANGTADMVFGLAAGSAGSYRPVYARPAAAGAEWAGAEQSSCTGMDFNTFTNNYRATDLIAAWNNVYQNGSQKAALDYLLALNTANPQLATALDILDRALATRYQSFSALCTAQESRRNSGDSVVKRSAEANAQCFAKKIATAGSSPDEALRDCAKASSYGALGIAAEKDNKTFLRDHTNLTISDDLSKMLDLLPDNKVDSRGVQVKAPNKSITQIKTAIEDNAKTALTKVLGGKRAVDIAECLSKNLLLDEAASDGCVPSQALGLIRSDSFLAARTLPTAQQEMYASAVSEQMASMSARSMIQDLSMTIESMTPKNIDPREFALRKADMRAEVARLIGDADNLQKISEQRANIVKTNLLAVQQGEAARRRSADQYKNLQSNAEPRSVTDKLLSFINP